MYATRWTFRVRAPPCKLFSSAVALWCIVLLSRLTFARPPSIPSRMTCHRVMYSYRSVLVLLRVQVVAPLSFFCAVLDFSSSCRVIIVFPKSTTLPNKAVLVHGQRDGSPSHTHSQYSDETLLMTQDGDTRTTSVLMVVLYSRNVDQHQPLERIDCTGTVREKLCRSGTWWQGVQSHRYKPHHSLLFQRPIGYSTEGRLSREDSHRLVARRAAHRAQCVFPHDARRGEEHLRALVAKAKVAARNEHVAACLLAADDT